MNILKYKLKKALQKIKFFCNAFISYLKKHKLISITFIFFIILITLILNLFLKNTNYMNQKRIFIGEKLYKQAHDLYFYGEGFEYDLQDKNEVIILNKNNTEYYKLKSLEYIYNNFTENEINDIKKQFDLTELNNQYYIKNFGRGISSYYGTSLTIKKVYDKKIEFVAQSRFCMIDYQIYDSCKSEEYYYTIDRPFTLIKEDGIWKIEEYTSVFEFEDKEFK